MQKVVFDCMLSRIESNQIGTLGTAHDGPKQRLSGNEKDIQRSTTCASKCRELVIR